MDQKIVPAVTTHLITPFDGTKSIQVLHYTKFRIFMIIQVTMNQKKLKEPSCNIFLWGEALYFFLSIKHSILLTKKKLWELKGVRKSAYKCWKLISKSKEGHLKLLH